jgi:hypothetical protein
MMRVEEDRVVLSKEAVQALLAFGPNASGSATCQQLLLNVVGLGDHETRRTRAVTSDGTIVLVLEVAGGWGQGLPQMHRVPIHRLRDARPRSKGEELHVLLEQCHLQVAIRRDSALGPVRKYAEPSTDFPPYMQVIPERFSFFDAVPTAAMAVDAERLKKLTLAQRAVFPDCEGGILLRFPAKPYEGLLSEDNCPIRFDLECPGQDGPVRAYGAIMPRMKS